MLGSKAEWVEVDKQQGDRLYQDWPEEAISEWHRRLGLDR
jgi:hypothetical protein